LSNEDCHACIDKVSDMSTSHQCFRGCYQSSTTTNLTKDAPCSVRVRRHLALTMLLNATPGLPPLHLSPQDPRPNVTHRCTGAQRGAVVPWRCSRNIHRDTTLSLHDRTESTDTKIDFNLGFSLNTIYYTCFCSHSAGLIVGVESNDPSVEVL
jgi:hypothetical protein